MELDSRSLENPEVLATKQGIHWRVGEEWPSMRTFNVHVISLDLGELLLNPGPGKV